MYFYYTSPNFIKGMLEEGSRIIAFYKHLLPNYALFIDIKMDPKSEKASGLEGFSSSAFWKH